MRMVIDERKKNDNKTTVGVADLDKHTCLSVFTQTACECGRTRERQKETAMEVCVE